MPLINCRIHLELKWSKDCVMSTIADTTFKITNIKLYVPIVTLSNKDNAKLVKLSEDGFNRPVYWNECQTKIETRNFLFLFLTILRMVLTKSKETVIRKNIFSQG